MIDQKLASKFNWVLLIAILAVSIIGVICINSANHGRTESFFRDLYIKQVYWMLLGLGAMLIALAIDCRELSRHAYTIYGITVLALIYVVGAGDSASGAKRWIYIGSFSLQISEFAKIALILALAKYFAYENVLIVDSFVRSFSIILSIIFYLKILIVWAMLFV